MDFLERDILLLKTLHKFLSKTFKGSSISGMEVDDMSESLAKAINKFEPVNEATVLEKWAAIFGLTREENETDDKLRARMVKKLSKKGAI